MAFRARHGPFWVVLRRSTRVWKAFREVTMAFGRVIEVAKVENPSDKQVDELHQRILSATKEI